jgi:hypothetical protein
MSDLGADKQCFGKLCIGANIGDSELPGPSAAFIQAKTDDGVKFNASVHEGSGLSRIHADKRLQITAGEDCSNDDEALNLFATKGNVNIKSENGFIRISGKNVVIDATETLTLGGRTIKIGKDDAESDKTENISITGNSVDTDADDGNLAELLGTGPLMSIFAGTALAGAAAAAAGIAKAAGGAAGQMSGPEPIGVRGAAVQDGTTIQKLNPRLVITPKTAAYILEAGDVSTIISITTGGVTVPSGVFTPGDTVLIYNNSAASQTITQGVSATLRLPGTADTGNRTLQQRGLATVLCIAENEFLITGSGLL